MRLFTTTTDAYLGIIKEILHNYEFCSAPRGMNILETLDFQYRVLSPDSSPIVTMDTERNKTIKDYSQKELDWYISGDTSVESAEKISKFWTRLANPDKTINSNYGHLLFIDKSEGNSFETLGKDTVVRTPYEWAKNALIKDKNSRQAIARVNKSSHAWEGNLDFVCTMFLNFHIRNEKLNISITQRSCDLKTGLVYDLPFFAWVQSKMLQDLSTIYPKLQIGYLTHNINSVHIYEKDIEIVQKMIGE